MAREHDSNHSNSIDYGADVGSGMDNERANAHIVDSVPEEYRKQPRQARARETVAVILQAAGEVLVNLGYAGATTNKIARRAGVSIGSLYQYFPNKDSIFSELLRGHQQQAHAIIAEVQSGLADPAQPIDTVLRRFFAQMVHMHGQKPLLSRALMEQLPRSEEREQRHQKEIRGYAAQMEQILRTRPEVRVGNPAAAAHILIQTLAAITRWLGHEAPEDMDTGMIIDESLDMIMGYLQRINRHQPPRCGRADFRHDPRRARLPS